MGLMKMALILTLARIFICPIFLVIYLFYARLGIPLHIMPFILLFILILCELSDVFDGIVARKKNEVTELGKILDPMADSIVRLSVLLCFTQGMVGLPMLLVLVFVCRDAVISTLRTLCALHGTALAARASGKLKAILQAIAIFTITLAMVPYTLGLISLVTLRDISFWVVFITAFYTILSGVEYVWTYRGYIKEAWFSVA